MINGTQVLHLLAAGCKRAGISLSAVLRKAGLDYSLVHYWRKGSYDPKPETVRRLSNGLLRSAAALFHTSVTLRRVAAANEQAAGSILDDTFGMCAMVAFAELLDEHGGSPPSEAVKRRAYALYEEELRRAKELPNPPTEE